MGRTLLSFDVVCFGGKEAALSARTAMRISFAIAESKSKAAGEGARRPHLL
jgi:hypothetical protein